MDKRHALGWPAYDRVFDDEDPAALVYAGGDSEYAGPGFDF